METKHEIFYKNASDMSNVETESVALIVTSPPYPMIEMWDDIFMRQSDDVKNALKKGHGFSAFIAMHEILEKIWAESYRVLKEGSFLCINIGDATRKVGDNFRLYTNHSKITEQCEKLGFESLPPIIWRKQTNAPNKFMGSGMLPSGAYVTLEHEYILIFRKKGKRKFSEIMKKQRRESAFFWEERNIWFSDVWDFKGIRQTIAGKESRERSGAYPFALAYRLINMYSLIGETVLDPFLGTGTTTLVSIASGRNSIGFEIDESIVLIDDFCKTAVKSSLNNITKNRLANHIAFIDEYTEKNGKPKHENINYNFGIITSQEINLKLFKIENIKKEQQSILVEHTIAYPHMV